MSGKPVSEKQLLCLAHLGKYREAGHFGYFSLPWLNNAMLLIPAVKKILRLCFDLLSFSLNTIDVFSLCLFLTMDFGCVVFVQSTLVHF